jgi:hypothetical protein
MNVLGAIFVLLCILWVIISICLNSFIYDGISVFSVIMNGNITLTEILVSRLFHHFFVLLLSYGIKCMHPPGMETGIKTWLPDWWYTQRRFSCVVCLVLTVSMARRWNKKSWWAAWTGCITVKAFNLSISIPSHWYSKADMACTEPTFTLSLDSAAFQL